MKRKSLIRHDFWLDPVFDQIIEQENDLSLTVCRPGDSRTDLDRALQLAHAYHVCAARDEVPCEWRVDAEFLERAPNLLCVSSSGAGYDPVDVAACTARGVLVVNQSGCNADSVAEHTLGLLLGLRHRIAESDRVMRAARYGTREDLMGREIRGLTIGLIGVGNIGRRVARLAAAFGMQVLGHDPLLDDSELRARGVEPVELGDLIARSDVVSLHCPLNDQTRNLFDAALFAAMKPGSTFLSTARGGIHDEQALAEALESGHLSGAGLDVWMVEPPVDSHPLLRMDNVVATYHTAGVTHEARRNAARMGAQQLIEVLSGRQPPRLVNLQAWPSFLKRYESMFG